MRSTVFVARFFNPLLFCLYLMMGVASAAERIASSANEICPLLVGAKVPKVMLTRVDGTPFDLSAAISQKPTVLIFYRGGW